MTSTKDDADLATLVAVLIDESGSMMGVRDDTIGGYNSFIDTIQGEQKGRRAYVSTFLFDYTAGEPVLRTLQNAVDIQEAEPLTEKSYHPRGSTPLYDAIGLAVTQIDRSVTRHRIDKVTFVIQTDGHENASREFNHRAVRSMIEDCTGRGWQVIFLGADLSDARDIGVGLGVQASNSMAYAKGHTQSAFRATASSSGAYRTSGATGQSIHMTDEQKEALGKVQDSTES